MRPIMKAPDARLPIKDDIVTEGDGGGGCIDGEGGRD